MQSRTEACWKKRRVAGNRNPRMHADPRRYLGHPFRGPVQGVLMLLNVFLVHVHLLPDADVQQVGLLPLPGRRLAHLLQLPIHRLQLLTYLLELTPASGSHCHDLRFVRAASSLCGFDVPWSSTSLRLQMGWTPIFVSIKGRQ
jgi:hypothetical protein